MAMSSRNVSVHAWALMVSRRMSAVLSYDAVPNKGRRPQRRPGVRPRHVVVIIITTIFLGRWRTPVQKPVPKRSARLLDLLKHGRDVSRKGCDGQTDDECRPGAASRSKAGFAVVHVHDALDDRESQTGP
jgi:hypothetical protein